MKTCTHKDCELKHFAKGFCRKHHARLIRNGSPNGIYNKDGYSDLRGAKNDMTLEEFKSHVENIYNHLFKK